MKSLLLPRKTPQKNTRVKADALRSCLPIPFLHKKGAWSICEMEKEGALKVH